MAGGFNEIDVPFVTEGTLQIKGSGLKFLRGVVQTGTSSLTDLGGGSLELGPTGTAALFDLLAGTLKGGGTITGNLRNTAGTVKVGDNFLDPTLSVSGDYAQGASGKLDVTVYWNSDLAEWRFGKLAAGGAATLAGDLVFSLPDGDPAEGTIGVIVSSTDLFNNLTAPPGWLLLPVGESLSAYRN